MPKAAVYKDNNALLWKSEVRPPRQVEMATPVSNSRGPKQLDEPKLRRGIAC
jgi:hypothetical protein